MTPRPERAPRADHTRHDPILLASLASGDTLSASERARLEDQLAACAACQGTLAELVALTASLRADLPAPRRQRDFRLTPAMARGGRGSPLLRWLTALGGLPAARPLAAAVCSIGLVLVLVGLALPGPGGTSTLSLFAPAAGGAAPAASGADQARNASPAASAAPQEGGVPSETPGSAYASAPPRAVELPTSPPAAAGSLSPGAEGAFGPKVPSAGDQGSGGAAPAAGPVVAGGGLALFTGGLVALLLLRRRKVRGEG